MIWMHEYIHIYTSPRMSYILQNKGLNKGMCNLALYHLKGNDNK